MKQNASISPYIALLIAACVLVSLLAISGCESKATMTPEPRPAVKADSVVFPRGSGAAQRLVTERVREPIERELSLPGRLVWDEELTVRVFPPFGGRVTRLHARQGDHVRAGQPLAEISSPDFGQAQADARKAQADLAVARKGLERQRELHGAGVASAKDLQQAQADHARASAEADRALRRLSSYGHAPEGAGDFVLRAPVAGTVVERNLNAGQEVRIDQAASPLFVISDPRRLWVIVDAAEADLHLLREGDAMVLTSNQFPEDAFAATLRQVPDFVDPVARTVKLRGEVPNPDRVLKAEMYVSVRLRLPKGDLPTVSAKAVYLDGARRYVFVRTGESAYTRRAVRVGAESEGRMSVLSGLAAGDEVVVGGSLFLHQILVSARGDAAKS